MKHLQFFSRFLPEREERSDEFPSIPPPPAETRRSIPSAQTLPETPASLRELLSQELPSSPKPS